MDDHSIDNHPDLMDPDWQRHAEKEAWVGLRRTRRRARRGRRVAIAAVVLVGLAGAGFAAYEWGRPTSGQEADAPASAPVVTTTTAPTELPDVARVDLSRPFENTPAQNWAEGIAGLTVAPAAAVGSFSAQQVGAAQDQVKAAITVAQFDSDMLEGHRPDKYIALLAPDARAEVRDSAPSYVIQLADGYHLLPVPPRMTGTLTVSPGRAGELVLHVAYVVAYAFDPGHHVIHGPGDLEPFVRVDADYIVRTGSHWDASSRGLWVDRISSYLTSVACGYAKTGRLTPAFSATDFGGASLTPEPGQFDPSKPMPTKGNCPGE